jgi:site-specific recombinase XerD
MAWKVKSFHGVSSANLSSLSKKAGLPPEKRKFHSLKHSIATHLLDAHGELRFVQDCVGHKNVQNTTKYA